MFSQDPKDSFRARTPGSLDSSLAKDSFCIHSGSLDL